MQLAHDLTLQEHSEACEEKKTQSICVGTEDAK